MTTDMTKGDAFSLILRFAIPLVLGSLLQQMYNVADAAIVGKVLGASALAGVGSTSSVQFMTLGFCIGSTSGFAIPLSRSFGSGDEKKLRNLFVHALFVTACAALVLTLVTLIGCHQILHLLRVPADIYENSYEYIFVIFAGLPFAFLYNMISNALRAVGDSKTPFKFLVLSIILNIFLDLLCIIVLGLGCRGAALATIFSQAVSGIACLIYTLRRVDALIPRREEICLQGSAVQHMLAMGIPMGLQFSVTAIGSMIMQSANNSLGSIYVSAFTAATKIKQFMICPFDSIAGAAAVFISQNLGAGQLDRVKLGIKKGCTLGVAYGILSGLCMILFGKYFMLLFIDSSETAIMHAACLYLTAMGCFFWILGFLNIIRQSIQAMGFPGRSVFSGAMELIARGAVSTIFVPIFGFTAIAFTDQCAWIMGCAYCVITCLFCLKRIEKR